MSRSDLRIAAAAIRYDGVVYSLPPPARHCDVMRMVEDKLDIDCMYVAADDFGFVLSDGRYARRKAAMFVAQESGQFNRRSGGYQGPELYSEDVW